MPRKVRKNYSPQEKVAILRRHFLDHISVSELCDQHQLQPTVFYQWQKRFFEQGAAAFETNATPSVEPYRKKITALEEKLARKNEVLSELMEAHIQLKKELGEP